MVNNNRWSIFTAYAALLVAAVIPSLNAKENSTPNGIEDDRSGAYAFTNANIYRANGSILNGGMSALITLCDKNANEAIVVPDVAAHYSLDKGTSTQSMPSSLMGSFALLRQTFLDAEWFTSQDPRPFTDDTLEAWNNTQSLPQIMEVDNLLLAQSIPVIYEQIYALPARAWHDVDAPFKTPFLLHEAGIKVGIGGGGTSLDRQRNLPFFAGTAAAYGLDRETALSLITLSNAEILGVSDRVGSLEVGKDATMFVSEGDALEMHTSQLLGAYIQGRDIDLFGTQQQLYERFREKYSKRIE